MGAATPGIRGSQVWAPTRSYALREQREALAARSQWDDGLTPSRGIRCQ
jgi:hypothetical protein